MSNNKSGRTKFINRESVPQSGGVHIRYTYIHAVYSKAFFRHFSESSASDKKSMVACADKKLGCSVCIRAKYNQTQNLL